MWSQRSWQAWIALYAPPKRLTDSPHGILSIYLSMTWQRLGQRVRELRLRRGMTQATLAQKAAISLIYVKKLEAGEFTSPSFPVLERIAKALKTKLQVELTD